MLETVVVFGALPTVTFSAPMANSRGEAVPYSQMKVGADSTLTVTLADEGLAVVVEHDEGELDEVVVGIAFRHLLRAVVEATYQEFLEARRHVIASQQGEASL